MILSDFPDRSPVPLTLLHASRHVYDNREYDLLIGRVTIKEII